MNNFSEWQIHSILVIGVIVIEIFFFTIIVEIDGNLSSASSNAPVNTSTTLTSGASQTFSPHPTTTVVAQSNSSRVMPPDSINSSALQEEVTSALNDWKSAAEAHNLDLYMNSYADAVDYYKAKGWNRNRIRADKQRAFNAYNNLQIKLENISISLNSVPNQAVIVMDKTWNFTAAGKSNSGSVQQQIVFVKNGSRWLITGERDLKVYYINSH